MQKPQAKSGMGRIMWWPVTAGFLLATLLSLGAELIGAVLDPVVDQAAAATWASATGVTVWVFGVLAAGAGGYIAARMAKQERVLHGVMVGGLGIGIMLINALIDPSYQYNGLDLSQRFLQTALAGVGGWLSEYLAARGRE